MASYQPILLHTASRVLLLLCTAAIIASLAILGNRSRIYNGFGFSSQYSQLCWTYIPNAILVTLGYALQGVDASVQSLQPYTALDKGSVPAQRAMLFHAVNHSVFSFGYYALRHGRSPALFASSMTVLLYPAIKIAAAGLYTQRIIMETDPFGVSIDTSLVSNLDKLPQDDISWLSRLSSSLEVTKFSQLPDYNFPPLLDTSGPFVFSNLAGLPADEDLERATVDGGFVSVNIPAVKVDTNCSSFGKDDFYLSANWTGPLAANARPVVESGCTGSTKEQVCLANDPNWRFGPLGTNLADNRYFTLFQGPRSVSAMYDGLESCVIGEFASLKPPEPNLIGTYNLTLSRLAGVVCSKQIQKVDVNVTLTRPTEPRLEQRITLPLTVTSFDEKSAIEDLNSPRYDLQNTSWIKPIEDLDAVLSADHREASWRSLPSLDFKERELSSDWSAVLFSGENDSDYEKLLDPDYLANAVVKLYVIYTTQIINQLRSEARIRSAAPPLIRDGVVTTRSKRMVQDVQVTLTPQILLGIVLVSMVVAFLGVDTKVVLPKAPNTIGAQVSLSMTLRWYDKPLVIDHTCPIGGASPPNRYIGVRAGTSKTIWLDFERRI